MIKLLLVDDDPNVLSGLRMRLELEADMTIVGDAKDGEAAIALAQHLHPDIVVMDVRMPGMGGLAAARELHTCAPEAGVIILSIHDDAFTRATARANGVCGFVGKHQSVDSLVAAIRDAAGATGTATPTPRV
jgi:DNA-binding NarL/FixJ family response regulator